MSFREKSQWVVLVTVAVVYGGYFADVLPGHAADVGSGDFARFAAAALLLVALQVAAHVALAIHGRRAVRRGVQEDERDRLIGLHASRVSGHVLGAGAFAALATALAVPGNFTFVHVLFGALVLAQLVEAAMQIVQYRRSA